jgi:hypothetical protein
MQFDDFDKIPNLFTHISQHLDDGDSLIDFFSMHYGCELENHKNDHNEHQKLPFKHQNIDSHIQLVFIPSFFRILNSELVISNKRTKFHYSEPSDYLFSDYIFQPPRIA